MDFILLGVAQTKPTIKISKFMISANQNQALLFRELSIVLFSTNQNSAILDIILNEKKITFWIMTKEKHLNFLEELLKKKTFPCDFLIDEIDVDSYFF